MLPRKVLIAYSSRPPIIEYLTRSFGKLGITAYGFYSDRNTLFDSYIIHPINKTVHNLRILPKSKSLFSNHRLNHINYRSSELLKAVKELSPDLVFIVRGIRFREDILDEIRKKSAVFEWWIEREERMEEAFFEVSRVDHYFFMNSSCVDEGRKRGLENISLLHHSVDTEAFYPIACPKRYDWCLVGKCSSRRMAFVERAMNVSSNAAIWGPGWLKKKPLNRFLQKVVKGSYIEGADLVRLYNETKVVLNVTNWGLGEGEKRSGMNMRVLEVPACRACLLTDGSRDLKNVVVSGRHVMVYEGLDDFENKLISLLKEDSEKESIASEGYNHVISNYTYDNLTRMIIERYDKLNKKERMRVK